MLSIFKSWPFEQQIFAVLVVASIPALLVNLGSVPFIEDEGIRGLVALEMELSGNYIAPTLNGEWYLKKPPLWNWILGLSFTVFGEVDEFSARFPTVLCLYGLVMHTFFTFRKHTNVRLAVFTALAVLTCGRILFWDSMLALIDIGFSWVVFAFFVWTYEQHGDRNYLKLYLGGYGLIAVAFMLKGFPAIVFAGLTFLVYQVHQGTWRKLFSGSHLIGGLLLFLLVGAYLLAYNHTNSVENLLTIFWDESAKRTITQHSFSETIREWALFPFEMIYHFLPWSLLFVLLLSRQARSMVVKHPFMLFCLIVFAGNIWVYWISPEVYPRYLIMFTPLYFSIGFYAYENLQPGHKQSMNMVLIGLAILLCIAVWSPLFRTDTLGLPMIGLKTVSVALALTLLTGILIQRKDLSVLIFFAILLTVRVGFDLFVLPLRATTTEGALVREDARRVGKHLADKDLYIYADDSLRFETSFYITSERKKILRRTYYQHPGSYLIVNPRKYPDLVGKYSVMDSMHVRRVERLAYIIKIPES